MEDEQLIVLFEERSERALTELDAQYGALCRQVAANVLGNINDAEECVNDAYLAVWNAIPPARPRFLRAYLCQIARNLAITRFHAQTAARRFSPYTVALDELTDTLAASGSIGDALETKALTGAIVRFLDTLPPRDRALFVRRYWFGDSVQDLAERFSLTRSGTAVRLHRLRQRLRRDLEKEGII